MNTIDIPASLVKSELTKYSNFIENLDFAAKTKKNSKFSRLQIVQNVYNNV